MATEQIFPYQAWTLTPTFKVVEKTIVGEAFHWGDRCDYHKADSGTVYHRENDLFETRRKAIEEGWRRLENLETKLKATTERIAKKRVTLSKEDSPND